MAENAERDFAVFAEVEDRQKPLVLINLTFGRPMDDVVVPYHSDEPFFVDGVPVTRDKLKRIKIVQQRSTFRQVLAQFHYSLSNGVPQVRKTYGEQYDKRLEAILRSAGEDVTSQVVKAFDAEIKPNLKNYLPDREQLIGAALQVFVAGMKMLGSG